MATTYTLPDGSVLTKPALSDTADITVINTSMQNLANNITNLDKYIHSGALANNTDLNTVGTAGHYLLSSSYTYVNAPSSVYFLIVSRSTSDNTTIFQLCYGTEVCAFRFRISATTWSAWRYVAVEAKSGSYSQTVGCMACGYVSNTNITDMYLEVPVYYKIPSGKTISVTSLKMEVRGDKGYVDTFTYANGDTEKIGMTGYTYSWSRTGSGNIYLSLTKSGGLTNVTNNTPVLAKIRSISYTLS